MSRTRGKRNAFKNYIRKHEERSPFGRLRRRWEDDNKKALKE
jgi:hypothetical protein